MPIARRRPLSPRQGVLLGVVAVALGLAVFWGFSVLASSGTVKLRLGDEVFRAGRTDSLSDAIERDGPVPFSDVAGGTRDIVIQHLGDDDDEGWSAFDARPPGASRDCNLQWRSDERRFVDSCSGDTYPADGEGLTQYETSVAEGSLTVDLRR